ncbi:NAD(P)H-binding protein [Yersinia pseudotuberculosis]|uniref:SDR family oxidoreductase n=3 Tax=Yersinia pseudotuberculosis TaxID=633 RepID=UPI001A9EC664|nr:SDR family oxidoreductase [Yersinia pseudotuberculosis]MBO1552120.1 NAD(P)H-binding protein [Yersinia pseudotuberculosis]MBO1572294.1 NAD(P)H-binding protein [Yersinia pseudotuberculosis]MBO1587184.1 NAD(P)H-binding protein [Yersinia pseudotuberculosis]
MKKLLVIGATGSIGHYVVSQALDRGIATRALVRDVVHAREILPSQAELFTGDATDVAVLEQAILDVDGVILTHSAHAPRAAIEAVDYGVVKKLLRAIAGKDIHVVLMTSFGVTAPEQSHNQELGILDWKRRSERLLRQSGHRYTIVRPGWFDYNDDNERSIVFLQGDPLRSGTPQAGRIARDQIARVLLDSLITPEAEHKTFELIAEPGDEQETLTPLFIRLLPDARDAVDGVLDPDTLPLSLEPDHVLSDLSDVSATQYPIY